MNHRDLISTDEAGRIAGVGPSSIKRWADNGMLPCVKTPGGHRRFDRFELELFLNTKKGMGDPGVNPVVPIFSHILRANRHEVDSALLGARSRLGAWYLVAEEIGLCLDQLGKDWERGHISVDEEHRASECLRRSITRICDTFPGFEGGKTCILAAAHGDDHTIGLNLAELCLREVGWHPIWLGRMTPMESLHKLIESQRVDMIALSASQFSTDEATLEAMVQELIIPCEKQGISMVLGGNGLWPDHPGNAKRLKNFRDFHSLLLELGI